MVAELPTQATTGPTASPTVQGLKLSSVVPAKITGDNTERNLTALDLAVKLHYLRGVYFFRAPDAPLDIHALKEPMFRWLELYYPATGRIRRDGSGGRPFVKCNDSGVRIVEGRTEVTVEEWLEMEDHAEVDDKVLVYDHVLGPDLGFTPLVFIQFTWFKCGGISVGLSWAHVLGDAFSASSFINMWGHIMAGHVPPTSLHMPTPEKPEIPLGKLPAKASFLKRVDPVGDYWKTASNCQKMRTYSAQITEYQIDRLMPKHCNCSVFNFLSALIWKLLTKIRGEAWPKTVTICSRSTRLGDTDLYLPVNGMIVGTIEADFSVSDVELPKLATWMAGREANENYEIEKMVDGDDGESDYILYGAKLTFVNLEEVNVYELELRGQNPIFANYGINGVGDEGVVLILPWRGSGKGGEGNGRTVTMILPESEGPELKKELKLNWEFI